MTWKPSKFPILKRRNSNSSTATNVMFGLVRVDSGLPSSRRVPVSLSPRRSNLVAQSQDRFRRDGMLVAMAFPRISLDKLIVLPSGPSFAQLKLSPRRESPTHTSCTSTCILLMWERLWVVEWEGLAVWQRCSRIVVTSVRSRTTSCKRRTSLSLSPLPSINRSICRFINTTAGWINLLLLSSSGPVKIPVGAWYVFFSYLLQNR